MGKLYGCSTAIVLHRRFAPKDMHAAETGPAAFVDTCRRKWWEILYVVNAARNGQSEGDQTSNFRPKVWGSWRGSRVAIVSFDRPLQRHLDFHHRVDKQTLAEAPTWLTASQRTVFSAVRRAAKEADVVIVWQPSKLLPGANPWCAAEALLARAYGLGGLYGYDEDVSELKKRRKHKTKA